MSRPRIILASTLSCALLLVGLFIGSIRPALTQKTPPMVGPIGSSIPARQAFTEDLTVEIRPSQTRGTSDRIATVPAGRSMILEYISGEMTVAQGQRPQVVLFMNSRAMNNSRQSWTIYPQQSEPYLLTNQRKILISQPIGVHLQAGDTLQSVLYRAVSDNTTLTASVRISGYLE